MFALLLVMFAATSATLTAVAAEKARRDRLAGFASGIGWAYTARDDAIPDRWPGGLFGQGHGRRATNVMTGTFDGRELVAFDYAFRTTERPQYQGDVRVLRQVTRRVYVVAVRLDRPYPEIEVLIRTGRPEARPESDDGPWSDEQDFDRRFVVQSADATADAVLVPEFRRALLRSPALGWRVTAGTLLAAGDGRSSPASILAATRAVSDAAALLSGTSQPAGR